MVMKVALDCSTKHSRAISVSKGKAMPTAIAIVDDAGSVIRLLGQTAIPLPVLCDECTAPDIAEKIPAFQAHAFSENEKRKLIFHFKACRPCRQKLGWGEL